MLQLGAAVELRMEQAPVCFVGAALCDQNDDRPKHVDPGDLAKRPSSAASHTTPLPTHLKSTSGTR